jgi:cyclophilin family peptidyl-prolyl cis-trans isomerase
MAKKKQSKKKASHKAQNPTGSTKTIASNQETNIPDTNEFASSQSSSSPVLTAKSETPLDFIKSLTTNSNRRRPFVAIMVGVIFIGIFAGFNYYLIPYIMNNYTDAAVQKKAQEESERTAREAREKNQKQLDLEDTVLNFSQNKTWQVEFELANFSSFKANLDIEYAPKTVENFIRLTYRDYFDDTIFHNMLKDGSASYVQGGDKENRDGSGGKSAFFIDNNQQGLIPDEIWKVAPQREIVDGVTKITNTPELRAPSLYRNLDINTGQVVYPKGTLFLVKENAPDSGRSIFGFTLKDSTMPANYTAFGRISDADFGVLDEILAKVNPVQSIQGEDGELVTEVSIEGRPEPELKISKINIISPEI